jgi:hypothetical protein
MHHDVTIEGTGVSDGRECGKAIAGVPASPQGVALTADAALDR